MAFEKLIIFTVTTAAKSGIDLDLVVLTLKDKAIDIVATQVEKQVPIELPFSVREILNGGVLPSNLLTPAVLNTAKDLAPPIPEPQRVQIEGILNGIESALNGTIQTVNTIKGALNTITTPLTTLETLASTLDTLISTLETIILLVEQIPMPLGAPPGVGVPSNVQTKFADILAKTNTTIEKIKPPVAAIPVAIKKINEILIPIVNSLNLFDPIFQKIIQIITFIKLLIQPGQVSQSDIDSTLSDITSGIQESLAVTAGPTLSSSNTEANNITNQALLNSLDPNSNNPLFYEGFKLTLEFDPNNTFSFPARRIKAVRTISANYIFNETGEAFTVTLYSSPPDQGSGVVNTSSPYSFSTSTQVLVDETKFNIDQYLLEYNGPPPVEEEPVLENINLSSPTPLTPAQLLENAVNQARQSLIDRGFTEKEAKWIMEKSGLLVQNVVQQIDNGLTPEGFFKQILINKGLNEDFVTYLLSPPGSTAFTWVEYTETLPSPLTFTSIKQLIQIAVIQFKLDSNVALSFFL
jgi:hypothetical protein